MARRGKKTGAQKDHEAEDAQPPLVPMSEAETRQAGLTLATTIAELEEMEADHKAQRDEMSAGRKKLRGEIASIASTVRNQGR